MNTTPPPPRYKIVERGRRLVTVDALTGVELGLSAQLKGKDPVFGTMPSARLEGTSSAHPKAHTPQAAPNAPGQASPWGGNSFGNLDAARVADTMGVQPSAMRWLAVITVAGFAVFILIVTQMWVLPVAAFLFPLTRGFAIEIVKGLYARASEWARGA